MPARLAPKRLALTAAIVASGIAVAGHGFGARGLVAAVAFGLLFAAWRHDNDTGTCLILAMLFLITCAVMLVLFYLLLVTHLR